ncbi:MAG: glycosyltransferase [Cyanobacteriota bacterium]|nr:glycosyltransferase [Cyanobacteriota bacterium]
MKQAFILLGAPRSGTSAISHMLSKLGVDFGDPNHFLDPKKYKHNPIFWELEWVNNYNDRVIDFLGKKWNFENLRWGYEYILPVEEDFFDIDKHEIGKQLQDLIFSEWGDKPVIGIKDPRFCFTFPIWRKVLLTMNYELKIVLIFRHPLGYLKSVKILHNLSEHQHLNYWIQHNLAARYFVRNDFIYTVNYDDVMSDSQAEAKRMAHHLNLNQDLVFDSSSVVNADYYHHNFTGKTGYSIVDNCYKSLKNNTLSPNEYLKYRYSCLTFAEEINTVKIDSQNMSQNFHKATYELEKLQSQLQRQKAKMQQLQSQLNTTQIQLKNTQIERKEYQTKLENIQTELDKLHLDLQDSHTQQEKLNLKLQQTQTQKEKLVNQLEQTKLKSAQSQSNLINVQNVITAMESSKFWKLRQAWFKLKKKFNLVSESEIYPLEGNFNQQIVQDFSKIDESNNQVEKKVNVSKMFAFISGCPGDAYRYRCHNQAEILKHLGYSVDVYLADKFPYEQLLKNYQVIIAHRVPYTKEFEQFVNRANKLNKTVIFDTDDLVFDASKLNQIDAYNKMNLQEKQLYESGVRRYRKSLELCDAVIVSTDKLKQEVERKFPDKIVVISRNIISDEMEQEAIKARELYVPKDNKIRIAYFSGTRTHAKDFAECVFALKTILKEYSHVVLMVVGHLDIPEELQEFSSQIEIFPLVPWQDLPELYRKVDINIAPLEKDNDFTASKSELKFFEAGLVSVPTVASNVGAYHFAIEDRVNGILCSTTDEWENALREMVINTELRSSLASKAFEDVNSRYLTRTATALTLEMWQKLLKQQEIANHGLSIAFVVRAPIAQTGGGYKHIFYLAHHLANQGNNVNIYVEPIAHLADLSVEEIRDFCEKHFGKSKAVIHCGHDNIQKSDIAIATNWPTAYVVNKLVNTNFKAYYVQDYESSFYESEDDCYTSAEKTYDLPLGIICLGKYLSEILSTRNRIKYPYIDFPLNPAFLSKSPNLNRHLDAKKDCSVLFFARPHIPRRNFALGVKVLEKLHQIRPDVKIKLYGMEEPMELPFKYDNLGVLSQSEIVDVMYSSDIHISFSMTNISTVVFEAMACGCATIEADVPPVRSMVDDGKNCLLVEPELSPFLEALIRLVDDYEFRHKLAMNGYELVKNLTVENMCQQFEKILYQYTFRGN